MTTYYGIQNKTNGLYYTGDNAWGSFVHAKAFTNRHAADTIIDKLGSCYLLRSYDFFTADAHYSEHEQMFKNTMAASYKGFTEEGRKLAKCGLEEQTPSLGALAQLEILRGMK